jgi:hypothetical protein
MDKRLALRGFLPACIALILAGLACGLGSEAAQPSITIIYPAGGSTLKAGGPLEILSTASAQAGVARVELTINGQVVHVANAPAGNPTTFAAIQPWTPDVEGEMSISVVAYDTKGQASPPATIRVQVTAQEAEATRTPVPEPTLTSTSVPPTVESCTYDASFVTDVTIPPDTVLTPNSPFTKIWRVMNSGSCDWEAGFQLVFASGEQMGGPASVPISVTPAGSTVDINVGLIAPASYGGHSGVWRLRNSDGTIFGPYLTVTIIVPAPATATATSTYTSTPPPTSTSTPSATPSPEAEVHTVATQISVNGGAIGNAVIGCPSGSVVTSGGFAVQLDVLPYTHSKEANGWSLYVKNNTGSSKLANLYAYCLKGPSATSTQVYKQVTVSAGSIGHPVAECPAGSVVTGGGWASKSDGSLNVYNSTMSANGWQIYARNTSGSSQLLNAYAICISGSGGSTSQVYGQTTIAAGSTGVAEAACPAGALAIGGGFAADADLKIYNTSLSGNNWRTYALNTAGTGKLLNSYAICLSLP